MGLEDNDVGSDVIDDIVPNGDKDVGGIVAFEPSNEQSVVFWEGRGARRREEVDDVELTLIGRGRIPESCLAGICGPFESKDEALELSSLCLSENPLSNPVYPGSPWIFHWFEYPCAQEISEPFASILTSSPSKLATPGNQTPLHCPLYSTLIRIPSSSGFEALVPLPRMVQIISPLTSSTPTLRLASASIPGIFRTFMGFAHLTRMRSALGKVPWIVQPSDIPAADPSDDSSSAKLLYVLARGRPEVLRVT